MPAPQTRCAVVDPRLAELSGLAGDAHGLWAMADGGRRVQVHRLDPDTCAVVETRSADIDPADAEDLARGPDGALWVGDIGDNERRRSTIAVIVLPVDGGRAELHRLSYPDGPHDAEALLVDAAGRPVVVTKEAGRPAGIYRTEARPDGLGPTPLVQVGEVTLPASPTPGGPIAGLGSRVVTGAAAGVDGHVVALRTYTDAWLYRVRDDDLVDALTGTPVRVPLPGEPQGEAIAFQPDGSLVSGSESRGGVRGEIRLVPGAVALLAEPGDPAGTVPAVPGPAEAVPDPEESTPEWLPAALGAGAAALVLLLVAAVRAGRRR